MFTDDDIIAAKIGKYQDALSNLCGVEYAYMKGDPDVDAIVELIDIYVQQIQTIDEQNAEIERLRSEHPKYNFRSYSDFVNLCKTEAYKEFWEILKKYLDEKDFVRVSEVDDFVKETVAKFDG